jgi:hypothetical protein
MVAVKNKKKTKENNLTFPLSDNMATKKALTYNAFCKPSPTHLSPYHFLSGMNSCGTHLPHKREKMAGRWFVECKRAFLE